MSSYERKNPGLGVSARGHIVLQLRSALLRFLLNYSLRVFLMREFLTNILSSDHWCIFLFLNFLSILVLKFCTYAISL